jgi:hypothetical protein
MAQAGPLLETAERIILAIFVVEIGLKLLAFGGGFFRSAWNVFDFVIVGMSLVPAAGPLSVLRTLRVLRVLRLLRTVPRLRLIIEGVLRVLPDMGWVLALLLLMFYVFSVMGTKLFGAEFPVLFGNLGATMFTLFQTMTLESWATGVARPVMERYPYAFIYFVSFLLITTFLILNMVIGVVVTGFQGVLQGVEAPPGRAATPEGAASQSGGRNRPAAPQARCAAGASGRARRLKPARRREEDRLNRAVPESGAFDPRWTAATPGGRRPDVTASDRTRTPARRRRARTR